jgi:hypothetical protein
VSRSRHAILVPLFAVLALLCCLTVTASAAFNRAATEPHYRNFLLLESEASASEWLQLADPTKENGEWIYGGVLGVPVYVRQNPWSSFDPEGLEAFNAEVYSNMKRFDRLLMRSDQPLVNPATLPSPLVRASAMLFFGEENHDIVSRSSFKALQDGVQAGLTLARACIVQHSYLDLSPFFGLFFEWFLLVF